MKIGCHLSSSSGFLHMGEEIVSLGGNCIQFFTRNPRGGKAKDLDLEDIARYIAYAKENHIEQLLAHSSYTLNPCAKDEHLRDYCYETMEDDLKRLEHIPGSMYNFHPGSHVGQGAETGVKLTGEMLDRLMDLGYSTTVLIETMAGKGNEIGRSFEEVRAIIDLVNNNANVGVCLDTCHVFDGGYDVKDNLDEVIKSFDEIIGLGRLKAIHLNDSKNELGSHKDRHELIGEGNIGTQAFERIIIHEALKNLPFFLETPNDLPGYAREIAMLKEMWKA